MTDKFAHKLEKTHQLENLLIDKQENEQNFSESVRPMWEEKCKNSLYVGKCPFFGVKFRLEKKRDKKNRLVWYAILEISGEKITATSFTSKESALATVWNTAIAERTRYENGIPDKIDWGNFSGSDYEDLERHLIVTRSDSVELPKAAPKTPPARNPNATLWHDKICEIERKRAAPYLDKIKTDKHDTFERSDKYTPITHL